MKRPLTLIFIATLMLSASCDNSNQKEQQATDEPKTEKQQTEEYYRKKGDSIAGVAFKTLSGELKAAMQRGGVEEALKYCNANALSLTDSVGSDHHVTLSRAAKKYRNPENRLNDLDRDVFTTFSQLNDPHTDILKHQPGKVIYYKPINLKGQCMPCHGDVDEHIGEKNYALIKEHYPDDRATGFQPDDLRGMWKIVFDRE